MCVGRSQITSHFKGEGVEKFLTVQVVFLRDVIYERMRKRSHKKCNIKEN